MSPARKFFVFLLMLFYSSTLLLFSAPKSRAADPADCNTNPDPVPEPEKTACEKIFGIEQDGYTCRYLKCTFDKQQTSGQGPWYNQTPTQFATKVLKAPESEIFGERYTYAQINWIINSLFTMLNPAGSVTDIGGLVDLIKSFQGLLSMVNSGQTPSLKEYAKLGPAGLFAGATGYIYQNPPASAVDQTKQLAQKLHIVPEVHAQGFGFAGLTTGGAVNKLWTATRNMAYLIMVILLIASGFLIMFRIKINPQTVVSLQTMIPKLIITMLLVTFSFAIAGLVIDLIYVVIAAFAGMLSLSPGLVSDLPTLINNLSNRSFGTYMLLQAFGTFLLIIVAIILVILSLTGSGIWAFPILLFVLAWIIWVFVILWKIFWMLLKAHVMMILQIIIAPLQIMMDLIPGQKGFGGWLRNYIANASVFATVPIMLAIQHIISGNAVSGILFGGLGLDTTFTQLGGSALKLPFSGVGGGAIAMWGIGFVIFSLTPKIADMIRDALKIPAFKYGSAIGEPMKTVQFGATGASNYYTTHHATSTGRIDDASTRVIDYLREFGVLKGKPGT